MEGKRKWKNRKKVWNEAKKWEDWSIESSSGRGERRQWSYIQRGRMEEENEVIVKRRKERKWSYSERGRKWDYSEIGRKERKQSYRERGRKKMKF